MIKKHIYKCENRHITILTTMKDNNMPKFIICDSPKFPECDYPAKLQIPKES